MDVITIEKSSKYETKVRGRDPGNFKKPRTLIKHQSMKKRIKNLMVEDQVRRKNDQSSYEDMGWKFTIKNYLKLKAHGT